MKQDSKDNAVSKGVAKEPSKAERPEVTKPLEVQGKNLGGRPSKYTPELVAEICERLSKGEPLAAICRNEGFPDPRTISRWCEERPDVSSDIAHAREAGEYVIAADCLNIADDNGKDIRYLEDGRKVTDADVVQRAKLRIDTRLKLLAKWNPKKWGDKIDVTTDGDKLQSTVIEREVIRK